MSIQDAGAWLALAAALGAALRWWWWRPDAERKVIACGLMIVPVLCLMALYAHQRSVGAGFGALRRFVPADRFPQAAAAFDKAIGDVSGLAWVFAFAAITGIGMLAAPARRAGSVREHPPQDVKPPRQEDQQPEDADLR